MTYVDKLDGRTEKFMPEKIVVGAVKSGASPEAAREIAGEVKQNAGGTISTQEIRSRVLEELGRRNPDWRRNREVYDQAVRGRG